MAKDTMSRDNWIKDETPKEQRKRAEQVLQEVKEKKGKTRLVQVDAKTWKEIPI